MKLRSIALAAALAASSVPALAVNASLGPLTLNQQEGFGNFFTSAGVAATMGAFSDTFTFSLASAAPSLMGNIGSFGLTPGATFVVALQDSLGNTLQADTTPGSFNFMNVGAGNYSLNVFGTGATANSFYGGQVTAVPEPETYALMLAGLGIIGFIGARRRERS